MARELDVYRRKRRFDRTPEPSPGEPRERPSAGRPSFMVHKHGATRLHYDLRLEMGGALASWAIPRGPSDDPSEKRLAIQTEDHPLEYAQFEGRIPEGEYGAGDALIWDRGTYSTEPPGEEERQREKGHLRLFLEGEKLRGLWHLVRTRPAGGKAQWLFFKAEDAWARRGGDVLAERPESVVSGRRLARGPARARMLRAPGRPPVELLLRVWPPMRAKLARTGELGPWPWLFEVKYDGYRALAALSGGRLALQSRNGLDLSARFPPIAQALATMAAREAVEAVIDGEIVAIDRAGRSRFEGLSDPRGELRFASFDLLWLDGEDLRARPIEERRELLESVAQDAGPLIALAERVPGPIDRALEQARRRKLEGLMAKRAGSRYRPGTSADWLKLKLQATQDVAVIGYVPISTGGPQIGALLVAVREGDAFRYAGKVGTGFDDKARNSLARALDERSIDHPPAAGAPRLKGAHWSEPGLVAQVAFAEWTRDGMMRAPSFQGLRFDKRPEECQPEASQPLAR